MSHFLYRMYKIHSLEVFICRVINTLGEVFEFFQFGVVRHIFTWTCFTDFSGDIIVLPVSLVVASQIVPDSSRVLAWFGLSLVVAFWSKRKMPSRLKVWWRYTAKCGLLKGLTFCVEGIPAWVPGKMLAEGDSKEDESITHDHGEENAQHGGDQAHPNTHPWPII